MRDINHFVSILMNRLYEFENQDVKVRINPNTLLQDLSTEISSQTHIEYTEVLSRLDYVLTQRLGSDWGDEIYHILDRGAAVLDDESPNFEALIY